MPVAAQACECQLCRLIVFLSVMKDAEETESMDRDTHA